MKKENIKVTKVSKQDLAEMFLQYLSGSAQTSAPFQTKKLEMAVRSLNLQRSP